MEIFFDAFISLDEALKHARGLEVLCDGDEHSFSTPLVFSVRYETGVQKGIAKLLPTSVGLFGLIL